MLSFTLHTAGYHLTCHTMRVEHGYAINEKMSTIFSRRCCSTVSCPPAVCCRCCFRPPVFPGVVEGGTGCIHLGGERNFPRMFLAAPHNEECLRDGQLRGDGGSQHPEPGAPGSLQNVGEFRPGECIGAITASRRVRETTDHDLLFRCCVVMLVMRCSFRTRCRVQETNQSPKVVCLARGGVCGHWATRSFPFG